MHRAPPAALAGADTPFRTKVSSWRGVYGRPGNDYQDSVSASSTVQPSYYTDYHKFGLDWSPGEVSRSAWGAWLGRVIAATRSWRSVQALSG